MCPGRASRGVHWCRSSQVDWGLAGRGGDRNSRSLAERHPPASPGVPVCPRAVKSSFAVLQCPGAVILRDWTWFCLPDIASIFGNGAVARESSRTRYIQNCFVRPLTRVCIQRPCGFLCLAIRGEVRQVHVEVAARQKSVAQRSENSRLIPAEMIRENEVQSRSCLRLIVVVPVRVVPPAAVLHLLCREAEQEEILFTGFLGHFDGRAVTGPDRQGSIHHEFHIARSTRFVSGGRDLVRYIARGNQAFGKRDVVLGQENNVDFAP